MKLASAVGAIVALLSPPCFASEACGVEVKVVLSPSETSKAVEALGLKKEQPGKIKQCRIFPILKLPFHLFLY